jgi:AraC-like DNA-binding protein
VVLPPAGSGDAHALAAGTNTIAEIARQAGCFDHSHFSRTFKQQYGLTPAATGAAPPAENRRRCSDRWADMMNRVLTYAN